MTFVSGVRSVDEDQEQVAVTFLTQAARFWVSSDKDEVIDMLQRALSEKSQVQVTWNPLTREILHAALPS
jgi:hypothetical protein